MILLNYFKPCFLANFTKYFSLSLRMVKSRHLIGVSSSPSKSLNFISLIFASLFNVPFDFEINVLPLFFLPRFSSFMLVSYISPLMVIFLLPFTFCNIYDPITSTSASLDNLKLIKFLFSNEDLCNPNYNCFYDIQREFRLHS